MVLVPGVVSLLLASAVHAGPNPAFDRLEEINGFLNGSSRACPGGLAAGADILGRAALDGYCGDAHAYLCGTGASSHRALIAREERARAGVLEPVYPRLAARLGFAPPDKTGWVAFFAANPARQADLTAELSREAIVELDTRFGSFDADVDLVTNRIRSALRTAIDSETGLDDGARGALRSALAPVRVLSSHAAVESMGAARVATKFTAWCGADGLTDNAFFLDGQVVLCPGFIVTLLEGRSGSGPGMTVSEGYDLFMTLAHEMAHSFERAEGYRAPRAYVDCLEERSGVAADALTEQMPEILADRWAAEAMAAHLGGGASSGRGLELVVRGAQYFCPHSDGDTGHPSPELRLGFVVGRSSALRTELGCAPNPPTRLGCGFSGAE